MKKVALLMTVGTGIKGKEEESRDSQGHGIAFAIERSNPEKIVFFCTKESEKTLEYVLRYLKDNKLKKIFNSSERIMLRSYSDPILIIRDIKPKFEEVKSNNDKIIVVPTFGTKAMTSVIFNLGVLYKSELYSVEGDRGENGIVKKGTETWQEQNVYLIFDMFYFDKVKDFFNRNNFDASSEYLNNIISDKIEELKKSELRTLIEGFSSWDKFDHKNAYIKLKELENELRKKFESNIEFVKGICSLEHEIKNLEKKGNKDENVKQKKCKLIQLLMIDLLANASRRISEGRYDDAVARLYRLVELIAQYRLYSNYNLSTNEFFDEVSTSEDLCMRKFNEGEMEEYVDKEGKLKIGLKKSYSLLEKLDDDIGKKFVGDEDMKKLLGIRNNSILAHGINPVDKKTAENLLSKVENMIKGIIENYEKLIEGARFSKL
ncbi:MAG: TIGR02710 family CRISPR-associated CARF protein [Candidatus Altiarchaeota archaeon]